MLISEVKKWHWLITWDNANPPTSSSMITALKKLGKLTFVQTKTTCVLAPKAATTWRQIRDALESNLHQKKGNVVYVNLRSGNIFSWGADTNHKWKKNN